MKRLCIAWLLFSISVTVGANGHNASKIKWRLNKNGNGVAIASNGIMRAMLKQNPEKEVILFLQSV